jgi:Zinc finger, C2H2 type
MQNNIFVCIFYFTGSLILGMQHPYQNMPYDPTLFHAIIQAFNPPLETSSKYTEQFGALLHEKLRCLLCNKEFNSKHGLRIHIANHSGHKRHRCSNCSYGTNNRSNFNRHAKSKICMDKPI